MIHIISRKRPFLFLALAIFQFIIHVSALTKGVGYIAGALTTDDTYYYLQTAWNLKQLGFPTFDGLNPTNGVQFLWFWIVYLLALVAPTKLVLLWLTMILYFLLNSICYLFIWKLTETLQQPELALPMASAWIFLSFGTDIYSVGMENSLHALIFWVIVWQVMVFLMETQQDRKPVRFIIVTAFLVLNVWTRIDAAIFSSILYCCCLLKLGIRKNYQYILASLLLALIGLIIQLFSFQQMGGTWLPISSLVKQTWGTHLKLAELLTSRLLLAVILLTALELLINRYLPQKMALRWLWYSLWLGVILHVLVTDQIKAYEQFLWYISPSLIFLTITLAYFLDGFGQVVTRFNPVGRRVFLVVSCFPIILLSIFFFSVRSTDNLFPGHKLRYHTALWMAEHLPAEARLASWNAGIMGYFSERTVINLDGLINGADYYHRVVVGPLTWEEYVREQEVDYIVDFNRNMVTSPEFPIYKVFSLPNHPDEVIIWQVISPETAHTQQR